jgi:AraC family ethanolamine operon transcriptional activator
VTRIVYQDIDEFAEAMRGTVGCFVRTARSVADWWMESVDLATSSMQLLHTGGPFTFAGKGQAGTLTFHMPLTDAATVRVNGHILNTDSFVVLREDRPFVWTGSDACQWVTVAVDSNHMLATSVQASEAPNAAVRRRTSKRLLDDVKQLIDCTLSRDISADGNATWRQIAESEIASVLTQALAQSVPAGTVQRSGRPQFSRSSVISSALACMNANEGQPLFIEDLCRATQVSERALRNIFHEFFGVGPMRLLKVRQLHEIRAALLRTQPRVETVTEVAGRFGVIDLSLLARNYKALFGESPSRTLHRPPTESPEGVRVAWLRHASRVFMEVDSPSI